MEKIEEVDNLSTDVETENRISKIVYSILEKRELF